MAIISDTDMSIEDAKEEIDTLINNARFRCFRPIRVAEILYHSRTEANVALEKWEVISNGTRYEPYGDG